MSGSADTEAGTPAPPPPGFAPVPMGGGFIGDVGPLLVLHEGDVVKLGFRVEARHCNPMHNCHGGMLATFCDMVIPVCATRQVPALAGRFLPTVSLQLDYMAPVPLGAWVEGQTQVLKVTQTMVFAQALVHADGKVAVRASGVFKIGPVRGAAVKDAPSTALR
jgi:uncharacterized protein (TIGR00369 family)